MTIYELTGLTLKDSAIGVSPTITEKIAAIPSTACIKIGKMPNLCFFDAQEHLYYDSMI